MNNTIKCKNCGEEIEITEALIHQLREEVEKDITSKEKAKYEEEISSIKVKLEKAEKAELELRKEKNQFDEEKRSFALEKQRQLDREREQIRIKASEEQSEKDKLALREKEEIIERLRKSVDELQRKANVKSQQLQGEVQELDLQELLERLFPSDDISEVKKGEIGADTRQTVKTPKGTVCGIILWESKRTKAWSEKWVITLKENLRRDKAHIGVIISEVLPNDFKKEIGLRSGVWVSTPNFVEPIANFLRKNLIDVARERTVASYKQNVAGELYDFITSHDFTQQWERMIEIFYDIKLQVSRERAASERNWKLRETQADKLLTGVSGIYGNMQGIAGSALPQIKLLQAGEEDDEIQEKAV